MKACDKRNENEFEMKIANNNDLIMIVIMIVIVIVTMITISLMNTHGKNFCQCMMNIVKTRRNTMKIKHG